MYFCHMRIDIITLHPELLEGPFSTSILKRAIDKKIVHILLTKRPEELSIENFTEITKMIESKIN